MFGFIKRYFHNALQGGKASFETLRFMWQRKIYFLLPIINILIFLIVLAGDIGLLLLIIRNLKGIPSGIITLIWLPFFIVSLSLVNTLISATTVNYTFAQLNENPIGLFESFKQSMSKFWALLKWSCVNGFINILTSKNNNSSGMMGMGFFWFLSLSWRMLSFFVIPILITTDMGIFVSIEKSYHIMKDHFGLNSGALVSFSIIKGVVGRTLLLLIFILMIGISFAINPKIAHQLITFIKLMGSSSKPTMKLFLTNHKAIAPLVMIPIGALGVVSMILATAKDIFRTAIYQYSQGKSTGPFSSVLIKESVISSKK